METKTKLNLTHSMELTKIFQFMEDTVLDAYILDLRQRIQDVAVASMEFGPGADSSFYDQFVDLKEILGRALQQQQIRETVNKY